MRIAAWFRSVAGKFLRKDAVAEELERELRAHLAHRADDLEREGLSRPEAERRAGIEFGGVEKFREESHEALGGAWIETLLNDVRYSARVLRKSPGFVFAAVSTLALAIGANAVVFSVLNAFLLRPLSVPDPQSLYEVQHGDGASSFESWPNYLDIRDRNHTFDSVIAWNITTVGFDEGKDPTREWIAEASGNYFDGLQLKPYLGRFFHPSDEHGPNRTPYIVLGYAFWHTHFHDDRNIIGRVVQMDRHPFTVIGVAPPDFRGTLLFFDPDLYVPLVNHPQLGLEDMNARDLRWIFMVMGHLKKGVTPGQAIADLNSIGKELEKAYPKQVGRKTFSLASPRLYGDYLGKPARAFFSGLMLLSGLILLAACVNLGSLFAARATDRSKEVALRLALGSNRRRILRGLFTEALLVSLLGGTVGLLGAVALLRALSAWRPIPRYPMDVPVNPDAHVYLTAVLLTLASGFFFGAIPVKQILATSPYEIVKAGSTGRSGRRFAMRDLLLIAQIAICAVLVTASFVAVRGLTRSVHGSYGFRIDNTLLADTDLSTAGYRAEQVPAMQKRIREALATLPGVESVALSDNAPIGDGTTDTIVYGDTVTDLKPANAAASPYVYNISPGYFHTAGTALLAGRDFNEHDDQNATHVAVVNPEFALRVYGSTSSVIGRYFKRRDGTRVQVVGLAEQGKYQSLTENPAPAMFLPILQSPTSSTWVLVHSASDPVALAAAMRRSLREIDPGLPFYIQTRSQEMGPVLFGPRMATLALGILGLMGAMLSITGIFGLAAYSVSRRLRELGVRMALGAQRKEVLQAALGHAVRLLAIGSVAGLVLGILASRVLAAVVYQATPRDPLVLAGVVLTMAMLGLVATWVPAQRALAIDPMVLLHEE